MSKASWTSYRSSRVSFMIVSLGVKPGRISWIALIGFRGLMLQALSEKHNSFLRPLKKKGFKEERVTTMGLYDLGKSHDPGIQQEPRSTAKKRTSCAGSRAMPWRPLPSNGSKMSRA